MAIIATKMTNFLATIAIFWQKRGFPTTIGPENLKKLMIRPKLDPHDTIAIQSKNLVRL
jgi:hypothetical protein